MWATSISAVVRACASCRCPAWPHAPAKTKTVRHPGARDACSIILPIGAQALARVATKAATANGPIECPHGRCHAKALAAQTSASAFAPRLRTVHFPADHRIHRLEFGFISIRRASGAIRSRRRRVRSRMVKRESWRASEHAASPHTNRSHPAAADCCVSPATTPTRSLNRPPATLGSAVRIATPCTRGRTTRAHWRRRIDLAGDTASRRRPCVVAAAVTAAAAAEAAAAAPTAVCLCRLLCCPARCTHG
eukprot:364870-Chlamydomonas_euryale.AAC.1